MKRKQLSSWQFATMLVLLVSAITTWACYFKSDPDPDDPDNFHYNTGCAWVGDIPARTCGGDCNGTYRPKATVCSVNRDAQGNEVWTGKDCVQSTKTVKQKIFSGHCDGIFYCICDDKKDLVGAPQIDVQIGFCDCYDCPG